MTPAQNPALNPFLGNALSASSELLSCTGEALQHHTPASETLSETTTVLCAILPTEQIQKANPSFTFSSVTGGVRTDIT